MSSQPPITQEQLAALPPSVREIVQAIIDHYERQIAELKAELAAAKKTPRNSSLPPSSEHPHAKPPAARAKSRKKRGGQPGHEKHARALIPAEQCEDVVACKPTHCRRCGRKLAGHDPAPLRHQVWELPEIKPLVTEYQRHRLPCLCGATTCGPLPRACLPAKPGRDWSP
jgi:transposase